MTDALNVIPIWIKQESRIIKPMIILPHPWLSVTLSTSLQPRRVKCVHLSPILRLERNVHRTRKWLPLIFTGGSEPECREETTVRVDTGVVGEGHDNFVSQGVEKGGVEGFGLGEIGDLEGDVIKHCREAQNMVM